MNVVLLVFCQKYIWYFDSNFCSSISSKNDQQLNITNNITNPKFDPPQTLPRKKTPIGHPKIGPKNNHGVSYGFSPTVNRGSTQPLRWHLGGLNSTKASVKSSSNWWVNHGKLWKKNCFLPRFIFLFILVKTVGIFFVATHDTVQKFWWLQQWLKWYLLDISGDLIFGNC